MRLILLVAAALLWGIWADCAAAEFVLVLPEKPIAADSGLTETTWRASVPPFGKYDKVGLHRYQAANGKQMAVMFYLPGTHMNGELAVTDENHNLWLYLAARGITVYTLDYRTHFVPNDPVPDLSFMKQWTVARFVDDGKLALSQIRKNSASLPIFVTGFSRGVTYAYILAGGEPVAGLIALDGGFKSCRQHAFDESAALKKLAVSNHYGEILARSRGWASRTEMMTRAAKNPDGPAMGKFPSIGAQVSSMLYYSWGPGVLANPVDGISSVKILAAAMAGYDRSFPRIQNIEGRAMASQVNDPTTPLDDHFGHMTVPVLYFGSTGMGPDNLISGIYSASNSGSKDVTINVLEKYGHLDVLYGNKADQAVYAVLDRWIKHRASAH